MRERVYLSFPKGLIKTPVLSLLSKQFDVIFNIRSSTVSADLALLAWELDGTEIEVAKPISWLKGEGVAVEPIAKNVID